MPTRSRNLRIFWSTLALLGCLAMLGSGLLLVDIHTRRVVFGDIPLPYALPHVDTVWSSAADSLPAPLRLLGEIVRAEQTLLRYLVTGEFL